jgi:hypothetical protein
VGLDGFEPSTPALSRRCSNQLSYKPGSVWRYSKGPESFAATDRLWAPERLGRPGPRDSTLLSRTDGSRLLIPRKEVIQPHLPIRLPCYDFTPVMKLTVAGALLAVTLPASGKPHSHGVTGGVYKTRERIHRGMLIRDY